MPKFFEYEDPNIAAHVEKIVGLAKDAEENETVVRDCQDRPAEYAINNREKPFAPMTSGDMNHRMALGDGAGKDHFVVAKHREEQKQSAEKYERMACDRDVGGTFHVSVRQMAKVAQTVVDEKVKEQKNMSFFKRMKEALSFSEEAKKKRAMMEALKKAAKKGI